MPNTDRYSPHKQMLVFGSLIFLKTAEGSGERNI